MVSLRNPLRRRCAVIGRTPSNMQHYLSLIFAFSSLPLQIFCQNVHDDWIAPAAPEGSTSVQSGSIFTLLWKPGLQYSFDADCSSCNIDKLDLWIASLNGTKYASKIGRK
jgi:hypothetical protein